MSAIQTLKWQTVDEANSNLQKLFNPQNPLDSEVHFEPYLKISRWDLVFQAFLSALAFIAFIGIYSIIKPLSSISVSQWAVMLFFFALLLFSLWELRKKFTNYLSTQSLLSEGRYRYGLFVLSEALLIHFNSHYFYAPRANITSVSAVFRGRSQGRHLEIQLRDDQGQTFVLNMDFLKFNSIAMQRRLTQWLRTGNWSDK